MSVDCWDCSRQSDSRLTQDKEGKSTMTASKYDEKVFAWIKVYFRRHGYASSFRDISQELNISVNTVHWSIQRLLDKGLLETDTEIQGKLAPRAFRVAGAEVKIAEPALRVFGGR